MILITLTTGTVLYFVALDLTRSKHWRFKVWRLRNYIITDSCDSASVTLLRELKADSNLTTLSCTGIRLQFTIFILPYTTFTDGKKKWMKLMTENKWRENLKETTRLITSQAFSLKITNLILELQYGLMVINFDRAHVHTHTHTHILSKLVKNYLANYKSLDLESKLKTSWCSFCTVANGRTEHS